MITSSTKDGCLDLRGLSTDFTTAKANEDWMSAIGNGTTFFEIDTGKVHMYDKENSTWYDL